jgi:AcrR family transcriptional regulator
LARTAGAAARAASHGFGHAQIAEIQRARILSAMFDVACERGAADVSVAHVVERSGVSRRTFYELFTDREDCFLAAFDDALALASERVLPEYLGEGKWRKQTRAALIALLSFLDDEPSAGRLLICESLSAGAKTAVRRGRVLALLAAALEEGRGESASARDLPALTAEGLVGGVLSVIHARILEPGHAPLVELASQLMSMIALPYLGAAAARSELERPVPARSRDRESAKPLSDPFKDAGMRLTYRTVRVLLTISEHPGASNRLVGEAAGITDQGQISKLLGRLQRVELISNAGLGPGQGAPNSWSLTTSGRQLANSIRVHTEGHR